MFIIPGIVALLTFVYVRPHEVWQSLRVVTFPIVLVVAVLGYLLDLRTRITRPRFSPLVAAGLAFFAWAFLTMAIKAPSALGEHVAPFAATISLFLSTSQGLQSLRGFRLATNLLLLITVLLAVVGIHQGLHPRICTDEGELYREYTGHYISGLSDETTFTPCTTMTDCHEQLDPAIEYRCERMGLLHTHSITGRISYRGVFEDPNELAWAINMSLPFAFLWFESRRSYRRLAALLLILAACITCNFMTQSRSGQIGLAVTLSVYFIRRFGWRGAAAAAVLTLPILLFGGRSGDDADSSSDERLGCLVEAFSIWRGDRLLGVGARQFSNHYFLTAHNSFMLSLAEMGPVGIFLWTFTIYLAFKIAVQVQRDFAARPEAQAAPAAAFAMLAGLVGLVVSAFFLSIAYHPALWIELGLVGAIEGAVRRHDPRWRLRVGWRDALLVAGFDTVLIGCIWVYLKIKGV